VPALSHPAPPAYLLPRFSLLPHVFPGARFQFNVDILLIADEEAENRLSGGLEARDRERLVQQALGALPPLKRKVVELVFWHDLPQVLVAEACGISPARVNQILSESFATMRPILEPLVQ
jgi:RNA polymerase sigma factor (sigma-70 family)